MAPTVIIIPLGAIPTALAKSVYNRIHEIYPATRLRHGVEIPASAFYAPNRRYRADSLITWMSRAAKPGEIFLGLTTADISITKGKVDDYGIFGFGFQPGSACIASSYRLHPNNTEEELFKVAIHELGHTAGLPHCENPACFMQDAESKNKTGSEKQFCTSCTKKLRVKGWLL